MLYPTHQPFFFHFHPFPSATIPTSSPSPLQKMECVEAALNNSIKTEALVKSSPQAFLDDLWALNAQNGATSGDFFVDDLLDFSNEDGLVEKQEEQDEEEDKVCASVSPKGENPEEIRSNESANYDFGSVTDSELGVPADDMASLEWLSHFVEDSFTEPSALYPVGILPEKPKISVPDGKQSIPETKPPASETDTCFKTPLPAKARSKRARNGVRVWSLTSPSSLTESSSSNSSSSSSSSCPSSPWLIYTNPGSIIEPIFANPPGKKQKKKQASEAGSCGSQPRRCSHCGVQKTPQWRAGPLGAKTLCNACGVRYKSGRLLPEYRPACSPTFSSELHSNHHRKVLEMRKNKEVVGQVDSGLALPSF